MLHAMLMRTKLPQPHLVESAKRDSHKIEFIADNLSVFCSFIIHFQQINFPKKRENNGTRRRAIKIIRET